MDTRQSIINKIAQMQRLTADSGAFEGEVTAAANMINKLMEKYSISWAEIYQDAANKQQVEFQQAFDEKMSDFAIGMVKKWHWDLAGIIAEITHTKYFLRGNKWMTFFGVQENAEVATALYNQWVVAIDIAGKDALKKYRSWLVSKFYTGQKNFYTQLPQEYQTKYYRESWIAGCLAGISKNIVREQQTSLVLYDAEVEKQYKERYTKMRKAKVNNMKGFSHKGIADGMAYGSSINVGAKPLGKGGK